MSLGPFISRHLEYQTVNFLRLIVEPDISFCHRFSSFTMPPKAPKAPITCNWMRSNVSDDTLADFVKTGYLPKKEVMSYRAPDPSEERPQPQKGKLSSLLIT